MLTFDCTDCKEIIIAADTEHPDQIFKKLDEHIAKCPLTFTFGGDTDLARQRVDDIRAVIAYNRVESKLRFTN